jgi:hypothetical protein
LAASPGSFRGQGGPGRNRGGWDDGKMKLLFEMVYVILPLPVKLVVKEDSFVKFCFSRRDRLLPSVASESAPGD